MLFGLLARCAHHAICYTDNTTACLLACLTARELLNLAWHVTVAVNFLALTSAGQLLPFQEYLESPRIAFSHVIPYGLSQTWKCSQSFVSSPVLKSFLPEDWRQLTCFQSGFPE